MAIQIIECGELSEVVLSVVNPSPVSKFIEVTGSELVGTLRYNALDTATRVVCFSCKGTVQVSYDDLLLPNYLNILVTPMSSSVFTDNFLMGLAGVVCGALIAFVLSKYAV